MWVFTESPTMRRGRYIFVSLLFVVFVALAYGGAALKSWLDARSPTLPLPPPAVAAHSFAYDIVIGSILVTVLLLTPALCFHVFSRSNAPNTYWRAFWTAAYLAFLVHISWAVFGTCGGDWNVVFHSKVATPQFPECTIEQPGPDLFLAAWWGLDVILAWLVSDNIKWVRVQRGAVHVLAFVMFFGATVLAAKAGIVARLLGILMAIIVVGCVVLRMIVRENDPKSLIAVVYIKIFEFLNLVVPWYKLPTWLAVLNLGALREVLRAKNLHNTSDIPVTNASGLRKTVEWDPRYLCEREEDGQYNDLSKPTMGNASFNPNNPMDGADYTLSNPGARFGRNIPLSEVDPTRNGGLLDPSPRLISNRLLARPKKRDGTDDFTPASILNLLAAAWIQFQTHNAGSITAPRARARMSRSTCRSLRVIRGPSATWKSAGPAPIRPASRTTVPGPPPTPIRNRTGGTVRKSTAKVRRRRTRSDPTRTASSQSTRTPSSSRSIRTDSKSPATSRIGGSV